MEMRTLVNASNATVENCAFRRTPSDAKALSVCERSVRKSGRESFALCDEGGAVAVFEPANP